MSKFKKITGLGACLLALVLVSVPFYTTVRATEQAKAERQVEYLGSGLTK